MSISLYPHKWLANGRDLPDPSGRATAFATVAQMVQARDAWSARRAALAAAAVLSALAGLVVPALEAPNARASGVVTATFPSGPSPSSPATQQDVTFTGAAHDAAAATATQEKFHWDFGDSSPPVDHLVTAGADTSDSIVQQFQNTAGAKSKPFTVTLTVTQILAMGNAGDSDTKTESVTVADRSPVAAFTAPAGFLEGQSVAFDGSAPSHSQDPDGTVATWQWAFGDGGSGTGPAPSHTYVSYGTYHVALTVTDDAGNTDSTTHDVIIGDQPPVASFSTAPSAPMTQDAVTFTNTSTDADGSATSVISWNFGDGTTAPGASATHAYPHAGTYQVGLTVQDETGQTASVTHPVTIGDRAPSAVFTASPTEPTVGERVAFDASPSSDPDGTIPANGYFWSFGDGSQASGQRPTHAYAAPGTYTVRLGVVDDSGTGSPAFSGTIVVSPSGTSIGAGGEQLAGSGLGASGGAPAGSGPSPAAGSTALGAPFSAPRLRLARLRVSRSGTATTTLSCPSAAGECRGRLTLFSVPTGRGRSSTAREELTLGAVSFHVHGGQTAALRVRISRRLVSLLARARRIGVHGYAVSVDPLGDVSLAETAGTYGR
ncbi:MAG TPA: PKD domain-containing protein [Solirubrobacteraceae bacterium]|nr:PKD domain-containing protein [Solirubrobacteraceae bacterium]